MNICACGCGQEVPWSGRGRKPLYIRSHRPKYNHASAKRLVYRKRGWIYEVKRVNGCAVCGETDPLVLDFHHLDPAAKDRHVSQMRSLTYETIRREMEKCVVLCCTHHKLVEAGKIACPTQRLVIPDPPRIRS